MTKNTRAWAPFIVNKFAGLNSYNDPHNIEDNEFSSLINLDPYEDGLKKRAGMAIKSAPAFSTDVLKGVGYLYRMDTGVTNLVFNRGAGYASGKVYHSSDGGVNLTEVLAGGVAMNVTMPRGVEYNNMLYCGTFGNGLYEYDGTDMTAMTGSPNGYCGDVVLDRLFLIVGNTNTVRFSEPGNFNGAGNWPATNVFSIGGTSDAHDPIVSLVGYKDRLVIFRQYSIYILYLTGTPANWQLRKFIDGIGAVSLYSTIQAEDFIYFVGPNGVYRTNLSTLEEISGKIQDIFENRSTDFSIGSGPTLADTLVWAGYPIAYWNNKIIFSPSGGLASDFTKIWYVYNTLNDCWTTYVPESTSSVVRPKNFISVRNSYVHSSSGDKIPVGLYWSGNQFGTGQPCIFHWSHQNSFRDGVSTYECRFVTKVYTFGQNDFKKIPRVYVNIKGSSGLTVRNNSNAELYTLTGVMNNLRFSGPYYTRETSLNFDIEDDGTASIFNEVLVTSFGMDIRQEMRPAQFSDVQTGSST